MSAGMCFLTGMPTSPDSSQTQWNTTVDRSPPYRGLNVCSAHLHSGRRQVCCSAQIDLTNRPRFRSCSPAEQSGVRARERQARPVLDAHRPAGSREPCPGCGQGSGKSTRPATCGGSLCAKEPHLPHSQAVPVLAAGLPRHSARAARTGQLHPPCSRLTNVRSGNRVWYIALEQTQGLLVLLSTAVFAHPSRPCVV